MAQSVLMIYEQIDSLNESAYWRKYINFYEKYWDGPATPQSLWWGAEYDNFREGLSTQLEIDKKHIKDCFFIKEKENDTYFVCPIGDSVNLNIIAVDNVIPLEWFLLFEPEEKNYFYTHVGFGAVHQDSIYYRTKIGKSTKRISKGKKIIQSKLSKDKNLINNFETLRKLEPLQNSIKNINDWLSGFSKEGLIVLNYGEICNHIIQESLKNENSVGELWDIINSIEKNDLQKADENLKYLDIKWRDILNSAKGAHSEIPTQLQ